MLYLPNWIKRITVGAYATNTYLLEENGEALIIDPGGESEKIKSALPSLASLRVFITHGHADHWAALADLEEEFPDLEVLYPLLDEEYMKNPEPEFLQFLGGRIPPNIGKPVYPPLSLKVGERILEAMHTPGHTPGHLALYTEGILFSGDLLFKNGVGRTDFPGGSEEELKTSLLQVLAFPPETLVLPGHGDLTTIGEAQHFLRL